MAKAGQKAAKQPEEDDPPEDTTGSDEADGAASEVDGTPVAEHGKVVASLEDDVAEARLRLTQAGIDSHDLDDASAVQKDLEIQEADRARVINDLIREHTPRTIIGASTPEDMNDADKRDVLEEIGRREYAAANLGKDVSQLTPQDLLDFDRQQGPDAVIESVLGKPLSSLSSLEQMQARSALRNQAFDGRRAGSGTADGGGSGSSAAVGGSADGGGGGSSGTGSGTAGGGDGGGGDGGGGSGDGAGTDDGGSTAGHTAAEPAPSTENDDAGSGSEPEPTLLIENGTLNSSDPDLDGQNVDLYEGSDGNFYVVTDDGAVHPFEDDGSTVTGGTDHAANAKMEGDPDGVDGSGAPPTADEVKSRNDLNAFFHRGPDSGDGATDPSPVEDARGPVIGPATDLRQEGLGMFGQPGDRDDQSFGAGSTEGTWNSDAGAIDYGPDGEAPGGPQRDDDRHESSDTIEPPSPSDGDADADTDAGGAEFLLPTSEVSGPVDPRGEDLPDEIFGPA